MVKVALFVRLRAKPGKEAEVEHFLKSGLAIVQDEPATIAWFGIRLGPSTFGIFDAFPDEQGRQAHLMGRVAGMLLEKAPELLAEPPVIEQVEVLGAKLPETGFKLLKQKMHVPKLTTVLGLVGIVAAGWFAVKRYFGPSTPYKELQYQPITSPM
jgi:quinol monooxygenase YgiN